MDFHGFKDGGNMSKIFSRSPELRKQRETEYNLVEGSLSKEDELYTMFNLSKEKYLDKYKLESDVLSEATG